MSTLQRGSWFPVVVVVVGLGVACVTPAGGGSSSSSGGSGTPDGSVPVDADAGSPDAAVATDAGIPGAQHLSQVSLTDVVTTLASDDMDGRNEGSAGWRAARAYVIERMTTCGLVAAGTDGYEQPITTGTGVNILGMVPGRDAVLRDRVVVLGAHYDHLGHCGGDICNGADDNAAAVALALGVGCALAQAPGARSLLVAIWDSEEPPTFLSNRMGSQFWVDNPTVPLGDVEVALALDLVGSDMWPGFLGQVVVGPETADGLGALVDTVPVPPGVQVVRGGLHLVEETPYGHQPWSDYDAFRNEMVPVLFLSNGQNKRYHTPDDEVAFLNLPKMAAEGLWLWRLIQTLADMPGGLAFAPGGRDDVADAHLSRLMDEAALAPGGLVDGLSLSSSTRRDLEADLAAVLDVQQAVDNGQTLTLTQRRVLRTAMQRIMCLAGPDYTEADCAQM